MSNFFKSRALIPDEAEVFYQSGESGDKLIHGAGLRVVRIRGVFRSSQDTRTHGVCPLFPPHRHNRDDPHKSESLVGGSMSVSLLVRVTDWPPRPLWQRSGLSVLFPKKLEKHNSKND